MSGKDVGPVVLLEERVRPSRGPGGPRGRRPATPLSPPPRPTRHWHNVLWWIAAVAVVGLVAGRELGSWARIGPPVDTAPRTESRSFLALHVARFRSPLEEARFAEQMKALHEAGYQTIGLDDVARFYASEDGRPLPPRPLLLVFPDAEAKTIDAAERVLEPLEMRAAMFVDVGEVDRVNLTLVSRYRLARLVEAHRWDAGVSACPTVVEGAKLEELRDKLSSWTDRPVLSAMCRLPVRKGFRTGLEKAGFRVAFGHAPPSANYRDNDPLGLTTVPLDPEWTRKEVVAHLRASEPRRKSYVSGFPNGLDRDWRLAGAEVEGSRETITLAPDRDQPGGAIVLGGTDRWRDSEVEVKLVRKPTGQFWIYPRWAGSKPAVRLGVSEGQVLLQAARGGQPYTQLASEALGEGPHTLKIRVVGHRALAFIDGRPLSDRPFPLPRSLEHGALALAVWGEQGTVTEIDRVRATPLPSRAAVVPSHPDSGSWGELRAEVDALVALSPVALEWKDGNLERHSEAEPALRIFAHYHHLLYAPAVRISGTPALEDYPKLAEQVEAWAHEDHVDGINVVIDAGRGMNLDRWATWTDALRARLAKDDRELLVTLVGLPEAEAAHSLIPARPFVLPEHSPTSIFQLASSLEATSPDSTS